MEIVTEIVRQKMDDKGQGLLFINRLIDNKQDLIVALQFLLLLCIYFLIRWSHKNKLGVWLFIVIQFVTRPDVHSPEIRLEENKSYGFLQEQKLNMFMVTPIWSIHIEKYVMYPRQAIVGGAEAGLCSERAWRWRR